MSLLPGETVPLSEIDLSSPDFWLADRATREAAFRTLRDTPGLQFFPEMVFEDSPFPAGPGYWALARHEDVWAASRNAQLFCSGQGLEHRRPAPGAQRVLRLDDQHGRPQALPAALAGGQGLHAQGGRQGRGLRHDKAAAVVDRMLEQHPDGQCDFVEAIAAPLPLEIICEMMGIPPEDAEQIFQWTNVILGAGDPEYGGSLRGADERRARDVRLRPGARRGPPGQRHATTSRRR